MEKVKNTLEKRKETLNKLLETQPKMVDEYTAQISAEIIEEINQIDKSLLILFGVVNCVYVVTERDNYGEQLFKGVFANREKAVEYLAEDGLKESNIDEINEIELN
tara:strand:- start:56 stop:373 length:318 start_codon:yes stop_codon:yes gene_type:complete